jgi:hypothetical protein
MEKKTMLQHESRASTHPSAFRQRFEAKFVEDCVFTSLSERSLPQPHRDVAKIVAFARVAGQDAGAEDRVGCALSGRREGLEVSELVCWFGDTFGQNEESVRDKRCGLETLSRGGGGSP